MKKKTLGILSLATLATFGLAACSGTTGDDTTVGTASGSSDYVNVVKLAGGDWFNRMELGNQEFAQEHGIKVQQLAGDDASEEKQIAILNDVLPKKPKVLTVVPNSPESVESVLKRARDNGITVITHEAPGIVNSDANIEAFVNTEYGAHQMDLLAQCIGDEGQYAHFVGSLTVASHNDWADGALAAAAANYPGITRISDQISSDEDQETAYQRTKEILATYPEIKGFLGSASTDVAGIGRAIQEAGLEDSTCVIGTSTPAIAGNLLEDGSVDVLTGWDPALAGKAMLAAAQIVLDGGVIEDGLDLGVAGYESLKVDPEHANNFSGNAWIDITEENKADFPF